MTDFTAVDQQHMARALCLAERGLFSTSPNPRVGCVIVREGQVVGEGWHRRAGEAHAEVNALAVASEAARGATAYVTLEPCCHYGRTPPCTEALLQAGIKRVIVASQDPNPRVAGQGLAQLAAAGALTQHGLMAEQAEALNPGFFKRMRTGLPYVRCKLAMSLDGRTAMASGESRWITATTARGDVHRLRARSDGILTGRGTIVADDPQLTAREVNGAWDMVQPRRFVLDSQLRIPAQARVLQGPDKVVLLYTCSGRRGSEELAGAELWPIAADSSGRVDPHQALAAIGEAQINEVLVEAGPTLSGVLLQRELIDELVVYIAPHFMGHEAQPLLLLPGLVRLADRIPVKITDLRAVGSDLRLTARLEKS